MFGEVRRIQVGTKSSLTEQVVSKASCASQKSLRTLLSCSPHCWLLDALSQRLYSRVVETCELGVETVLMVSPVSPSRMRPWQLKASGQQGR